MDFLFQPEVLPFTVALFVMLAIALIEGVGMMLGMGLSGLVDQIIPDMDLPEIDVDIDADAPAASIGTDIDTPHALAEPGAFGKFLAWLRIGQVPVLILFIVFLVGFGLSGLIIQQTLLNITGLMLPAMIASVPAFMISMPCVRIFGGALAAIIPKDATEAISSDTFIGRIAVITAGKATKDSPAQGKTKDQHGRSHYIRIAPDIDSEVLNAGEEILIVKKSGSVFYGIKNENAALKKVTN